MINEAPTVYLVHLTYFVDRDVWILSINCPESEATLLKLRLGVVPLLIDDELLEAREEADLREDPAILLKWFDNEMMSFKKELFSYSFYVNHHAKGS